MVADDDLIGATILIAKYKFHEQFDIPDMLVRLVEDHQRMDAAKNLVKGVPRCEKEFINVLVSLKDIKNATKMVKEFKLNCADFPMLVERASFNTANYFTSQCFRAVAHPDHIPLHKVEDLFSNEPVMIGCLVSILLKRW